MNKFLIAIAVLFGGPLTAEEATFERGTVTFDSAGAGAVFARCGPSPLDRNDAVCEVFAEDTDGLRCLFLDASGEPVAAAAYDDMLYNGFWLGDFDGSVIVDAVCVRD